jgi:hypothetical protein
MLVDGRENGNASATLTVTPLPYGFYNKRYTIFKLKIVQKTENTHNCVAGIS